MVDFARIKALPFYVRVIIGVVGMGLVGIGMAGWLLPVIPGFPLIVIGFPLMMCPHPRGIDWAMGLMRRVVAGCRRVRGTRAGHEDR